MKDFTEEFKQLIEKFKKRSFEYGKPKTYLEFRNGASIEEMEKELIEFKDLKFTEKQIIHNKKRFKTYHVYSSKKERLFCL
jgi:predicted ribosome quality control (RQC) complex YloA/Tae2 family protein